MERKEVYLMDKSDFNLNYLSYAQKIAHKLGLGKVDTVFYSYNSVGVRHDCNGLHIYVRREQTPEEFTSGKSDDELYKDKIEKALRQHQSRKSGSPEKGQSGDDFKKRGAKFLADIPESEK